MIRTKESPNHVSPQNANPQEAAPPASAFCYPEQVPSPGRRATVTSGLGLVAAALAGLLAANSSSWATSLETALAVAAACAAFAARPPR